MDLISFYGSNSLSHGSTCNALRGVRQAVMHACDAFRRLSAVMSWQDGRLLLTSGGFAGPRGTSATYVYQSSGCVGTAPPAQGA